MKIKRCLIAALALACLCGCNSGANNASSVASTEETGSSVEVTLSEAASEAEAESTAAEDSSASGLKGVFEEISSTVELPDMVELNDNLLNRYYGLSTDVVADYAGGVDSSGVGQDEIALFKAADESQVAEIEQALQTRYDSKLAQQENYNPDEAEKIRNCKVETNGLYVTLIISNDAAQITDIVNNAITE